MQTILPVPPAGVHVTNQGRHRLAARQERCVHCPAPDGRAHLPLSSLDCLLLASNQAGNVSNWEI